MSEENNDVTPENDNQGGDTGASADAGNEATQEAAPAAEPTPAAEPAAAAPTGEVSKTVAIVSHFTLIGFIIALVMHGDEKNKNALGAFYLRQMLGIFLGGLVSNFIPIVNMIAWLFWLVMWIISVIGAFNGQQKEIPLVGKLFQKWFATTFKDA